MKIAGFPKLNPQTVSRRTRGRTGRGRGPVVVSRRTRTRGS